MYSKDNKIKLEQENLGNYIEGFDVYNSLLLHRLRDQEIPREIYQVTSYDYRPDLIALDYYGSEGYTAFVIIQAKIGMNGYTRGTYLKLIPKDILDSIIREL